MNTTSISLLQRLRHGAEPDAWKRFADLYTPLLFYWARRLGLQEPDAADLVQDVFVRLVRKLPDFTYDQSRSFRSWLHTVLLNQHRSSLRKPGVPVVQRDPGRSADFADSDPILELDEAEYSRYLAQRALRLMQAHFQPTTWQACWQQVVEGRTAAEVAAALGISEGAAWVAKSRVLRRLQQEFQGLLD